MQCFRTNTKEERRCHPLGGTKPKEYSASTLVVVLARSPVFSQQAASHRSMDILPPLFTKIFLELLIRNTLRRLPG